VQGIPSVSIIVPVGKNSETLGQLIESVDNLDYPSYELILACEESIDVSGLASNKGNTRVVEGGPGNPSKLRNLGMKTARYDILAFIDSDCAPRPEWLREMIAAKIELGTKIVMGKTFSANREASRWASISADRYAAWFDSTLDNRFLSRLDTKNLVMEKQLLLDLGQFDESLDSKEDRDLGYRVYRAGEKIGFAPMAMLEHSDPETLGQAYRRAVWYSRGMGQFRAKYGRGLLEGGGDLVFYKGYVRESVWAGLAILWFVALAVIFLSGLIRGIPLLVSILAGFGIGGVAFRSLGKSVAKFVLRRSSWDDLLFDIVSDLGHKRGYLTSILVSFLGKEGRPPERHSRGSES
jgi:cellulose synthase/poly-beta-1,6-N-acetylglucosamine synthase-like glycosyltransferase